MKPGISFKGLQPNREDKKNKHTVIYVVIGNEAAVPWDKIAKWIKQKVSEKSLQAKITGEYPIWLLEERDGLKPT